MTLHILDGACMPLPSAIPMLGPDGLLRFAVDPREPRMMADMLGRLVDLVDRSAAEAAIERLIAILDWRDGDADLEDENEHGGDVCDGPHDDDEREMSLGWSERDGQGARVGIELAFSYSREADHDHL